MIDAALLSEPRSLLLRMNRAARAIAAASTEEESAEALVGFAAYGDVDVARVLVFTEMREGRPSALKTCAQWTIDDRPVSLPGTGALLTDEQLLEFMHANSVFICKDVATDERLSEPDRGAAAISGLGAFAAIPLTVGQNWLGALIMIRDMPSAFDEELIHAWWTLASQAATVMQNATLSQETQRRFKELSVWLDASATISASLDVDESLQTTAHQITTALSASGCAVSAWDRDQDSLVVMLDYSIAPENWQAVPPGTPYRLADYPTTRHVLNHRQPVSVHVSDRDADPAEVEWMRAEGIKSVLMVPLIARDKVIGLLELVHLDEEREFTPTEIGLCQTLANQAAAALETARLFEQTQRRSIQLQTAAEISHATGSILDPDELIEKVVNLVRERFGLYYTGLFLLDESGQSAILRAATGEAGRVQLEQAHRLAVGSASMIGSCLENGQALISQDVESEETRFVNPLLPDTRSEMALPLISRGQTIGAMTIQSAKPAAFSKDDIYALQSMTDQLANAIQNARLFDNAWSSTRREQALRQTTAIINKSQDLAADVTAIAENLSRFVAVDMLVVISYTPGESEFTVLAAHAAPRNAQFAHPGTRSPMQGTAPGWVIARNEPRLDADIRRERPFASDQLLITHGLVSRLVSPMRIADNVIGTLYLASKQVGAFSEADLPSLNQVADQIALALERARLLEETRVALAQVEATHRRYLRKEWADILAASPQRAWGYTDGPDGLAAADDTWTPEIEDAVAFGEVTTTNAPTNDGGQPPHSGLAVPIQLLGQTIGVMDFHDSARIWTEDDKTLVKAVADQVALAVENARLLEETQTSLAETERLYKASGRLSGADSAEEVVEILAEEFHKTLGPSFSGSILRAGPDPTARIEWLDMGAQWNVPAAAGHEARRFSTSGHPAFRRFLQHRGPLLIKDTDTRLDGAFPWEDLTKTQPSTILAIPLVVGSSWLGVIHVSSQEDNTPNIRTMRFLQNLADRAAVALESARLHQETQRRATQLEAAAKVSRAANSILEQERLLSTVVDLIKDRFGYYHAQVFLLDPAGQWAILKASTGEIGERLLKRGHALRVGGDSLIGHVTSKGVPRNASDVGSDPIHFRNPDLPATRSELAVPLKVGAQVIGALDVQSTEPAAFGPDAIAVLSTLSDQLAIAIENARLYQTQIETAKKLREVDRLKSQFMANMSHELRTPLNSIIGFSRVILKGIDGPISELQKQDLTAIYNSGQLLLRLINDILDLAKIESGKMKLAFDEIELTDIIAGVMATAAALIKDKPEIVLKQSIPIDLPPIIADGTRLRQVFLNLLSNAAKFSEKGHIELAASHAGRWVTIKVSDSGLGIPADKFDVIFQEFEQVDGSSTRAVGGTGLGLPISKRFVEMHGGQMWVESELSVGSTFTVRLPINGPQSADQDEEEGSLALDRRLILAIDDDPDAIKLYQTHLETRNYQVIGVSDSEEAIRMTRELRPYAVLLDLLMPDPDGWSIIEELKADPETQDIPVIVCSVVSAAGRGFSLGAADFLVKPITEDLLLASLDQLENRLDREPGEALRILIIDDVPHDRRLLRRTIESADEPYEIAEAAGGLEGIESIQHSPPDLVVLDLMMPELDGFAVLESLKSDRDLRRIPIIIVTAKDLTNRERARINGQVAALFQKGLFDEDELLQDLNRVLHPVRKRERERRTRD